MHFGENQLSPGSLGISPLPTGHPRQFAIRHGFGPPRAVTARFTLAMGSSPGFGSVRRDSPPSSDSLSLRLRLSLP